MGSVKMRGQTDDKKITSNPNHSNPLISIMRSENLHVCDKQIHHSDHLTSNRFFQLKYESSIHNIAFSSEKVISSESVEKMSEWKWNDVWSSMLTHALNLCSAFNPFKCSHTVVNTHREHTPLAVGNQCCGAWGAVGGLVPCSRVSPQSWYWKWRERWLFTITNPPTISARPETRSRDLSREVHLSIH